MTDNEYKEKLIAAFMVACDSLADEFGSSPLDQAETILSSDEVGLGQHFKENRVIYEDALQRYYKKIGWNDK